MILTQRIPQVGDKLLRFHHKAWYWCWDLKLHVGYFPSHPRGYRENPRYPVLRGLDHCRYCLCAPCVIQLPPDFLRGSASPHPANDEKRYRLYRLFWKLLSDVGLWCDDEYLQRKEARTVIHDKRDIIPNCVITVSTCTRRDRRYMYKNPYRSLYLPGNQVQIPKSRWAVSWLQVHIRGGDGLRAWGRVSPSWIESTWHHLYPIS
jgi:hypothetical protein